MNRLQRFLAATLATALVAGCASAPAPQDSGQGMSMHRAALGMRAPQGVGAGGGAEGGESPDRLAFEADGPYPVDLSFIPARVFDPNNQLDRKGTAGRIESPLPDEVIDLLRGEARRLPPSAVLQSAGSLGPEQLGPAAGAGFDSLDYRDCCGGGGNVPPDPELTVGPDHIIAVVNVAFEIYDKSGTVLAGPITFSSFFNGTPGCSSTAVFDPNVLYDEEYDRFILGIDGNGTDYCVAATTGPDPTGSWSRYAFTTASGADFFDYPHAGVGLDAIYVGANIFRGSYVGSRVWAMDKLDLYAGLPLSVVQRSTGLESTPQPMNLHGFSQGTWPAAGPHYIVTDDVFDGATYGVWSWEDPFGADLFTDLGTVNLVAFTGIAAGMPIEVPQLGSTGLLQGNDYRVQDAEYRNGYVWIANTVACNPGSGTVNCVRWAQIDPAGPTVIDAGVYASNGEYRTFADVAVNDCDDLAIGYTKSSGSMYPAVFVTGRESADAPGTLQAEVQVKAGEKAYSAFDGSPFRWGDYSGMTIDPDGETFWYLGEYSKNLTGAGANWGTYIGSFSFAGCSTNPQAPGKALNPLPADGAAGVSGGVLLSWTAGSGAASHDVYFDGVLQGNQPGTTFDPPGTLIYESAHTWRVDEVNAIGTTAGDTWSFTVESEPLPPQPAGNPIPVDGATGVSPDVVLSWTAGAGALSHDVYFNGTFQVNQAGTSFDPPGSLSESTAYSWRVDEVNAAGTTAGPEWGFKTGALPAFRIASVSVTTELGKGARNRGIATVTVLDESDSGVSGVAVSGTFSGDWSGTRNGTTDSAGQVVLETPTIKNGNSWQFCVDTANRAGWKLDEAASAAWLCNGPPPATGSIAGVVTDADTAAAVAGAGVSTDSGQSATTDSGGSYTLTDVPTGTRTVEVSASGYDTAGQQTTVTEGATSTLNFALLPTVTGGGTGTLKGTVSDSSGTKLGGVTIQVVGGPSGTSNNGGKYSIASVPEGEQTVAASKAGYSDATLLVTISAGSTVTLDLSLDPQ